MPISDYQRIERAIRYLQVNFRQQPSLEELAAGAGLSAFHFQRLFRRWAGISPKRYAQYLTADYAARLLHNSHNVLDASLAAGLSGAGRLHDLLINIHGVSPGEVRRGGAQLDVRYGVHASPFGDCLLATTARGVCGLAFLSDGPEPALTELMARWPQARWIRSPRITRPIIDRIFPRRRAGQALSLDLHVPGTNFQIKVWEALLRIPPGAVTTYGGLAAAVQAPQAARAVGTAMAQNPVAYLIPCHRVIRVDGGLGEYHWGIPRKHAMLAWEGACVENCTGVGKNKIRIDRRRAPE